MSGAKINVGVIGIGGFAKKIIEQIDRHPHFQIRRGYHPVPEKALNWDPKKGTSSLDDVMKDGLIEAIFVLTPTHTHAEYCQRALEANKHVFVEKPLTHTLESAGKVEALLKASSFKFMVGHNFRRQSWHREIKRLLETGKIGKTVNITVNRSHGAIFHLPENSWRKNADFHAEGPLATVGIHYMDLIHYWFGPVRSVRAVIMNVSGQSDAPDANAVLMVLENGTSVFLQTNYCQCSENYTHIYGTDGTIYCERDRLALRVGRDQDRVPSERKGVLIGTDNSIYEEVDEFYRAIVFGGEIETGLKEAMDCMIVLDACRKSHLENREIYLKEYPGYFESSKVGDSFRS